jgi:hypothetical protein
VLDHYEAQMNNDKSAGAVKITRKGLYEVGWLASLLESLGVLQEWVAWEAEDEGDNSEVPAQLLAAMHALGAVLVNMTAEEVGELLAGGDPGEGDPDEMMMAHYKRFGATVKAFTAATKAGKVLSSANHEKLSNAHAMIGDVLQSAAPTDDDTDDAAAAKAAEVQRRRIHEHLALATV